MVAEVIVELGNGRGLESGLLCNSVTESPDSEWHVARCYLDTYILIGDGQ